MHLKTFTKDDILVIPFDASKLLEYDVKGYLGYIQETYKDQSMKQPVIVIFPLLDKGKWLRYELCNIYLTNNHLERDYVDELCSILNAPTGLDIAIEFIRNFIKNGSFHLSKLNLKYQNVNEIPLVSF